MGFPRVILPQRCFDIVACHWKKNVAVENWWRTQEWMSTALEWCCLKCWLVMYRLKRSAEKRSSGMRYWQVIDHNLSWTKGEEGHKNNGVCSCRLLICVGNKNRNNAQQWKQSTKYSRRLCTCFQKKRNKQDYYLHKEKQKIRSHLLLFLFLQNLAPPYRRLHPRPFHSFHLLLFQPLFLLLLQPLYPLFFQQLCPLPDQALQLFLLP
eukprot:Lithocolla_globosa_v1_NODE_1705_length_2390_cov_6.334904.p2 type:complete len:208 gc:universal NODE_1705_length_2390_cov_6.334904:974-351(-)